MLIVKVFVNCNLIDEIRIHNKGYVDETKNDVCNYQIISPKGFENIAIYHSRKEHWGDLLEMALFYIRARKGEYTPQ
jgi:hypothetical protein